jgi:arylsulfatase A
MIKIMNLIDFKLKHIISFVGLTSTILFAFKLNKPDIPTLRHGRPNIIVFMADDFGYDLPAYTGNQTYETPNLDFMATNGMRFTKCYSHPDGYPSRLAFQTGKYNHTNYTFWGKLPAGAKTIGNLLKDGGYQTMYLGRWSFDGGDSMIRKAGFDNYIVTLPFAQGDQDRQYRHFYKDPFLYHDGYLDSISFTGMYSEDIYFDYFQSFIDSLGQRPFFVMYANTLVREPLCPSPDHPEFNGYQVDTAISQSNNIYFPSMISYFDKVVGKVISKLEREGLAENTVIIVIGDNATDKGRSFLYNGKTTNGKKNETDEFGTLTPLTVYWPGAVRKGTVCDELINYTDFLPTIAKLVGRPIPVDFGTIHGQTFHHNLFNSTGANRSWNYTYWDNSPNDSKNPIRFIHDKRYKLYKDTFGVKTYYKIDGDLTEKHPLSLTSLTDEEQSLFNYFEFVIDSLWTKRFD